MREHPRWGEEGIGEAVEYWSHFKRCLRDCPHKESLVDPLRMSEVLELSIATSIQGNFGKFSCMVSRESHVSHMMLRSLCGCPTNKVDDKDVVVVKDYRDTVFIYASHKVLTRALIGTLFKTLEQRNLKPTGINMIKPSKELLQKSAILKKSGRGSLYMNEVCVVSLWHGDEVIRQASGAITHFCKHYAFVQGVDVVMTDSTKSTRNEAKLWIDSAPPVPPTPQVTEAEPAPDAEPPNLEEEQEPVTVIEAGNEHVSPPPLNIQDPDDVVLVRESSTADTLPVGDKPDTPQEAQTAAPPVTS
ncbi:hypothetical protein Y032_0056g2675 [Ancylostoma ceylanicum]|nr:hypothetical protein Y032_0056g2675 [Ancylostoma ceylanicum]